MSKVKSIKELLGCSIDRNVFYHKLSETWKIEGQDGWLSIEGNLFLIGITGNYAKVHVIYDEIRDDCLIQYVREDGRESTMDLVIKDMIEDPVEEKDVSRVDENIREIIKILHMKGYDPYSSCAGKFDINNPEFPKGGHISFIRNITKMAKHLSLLMSVLDYCNPNAYLWDESPFEIVFSFDVKKHFPYLEKDFKNTNPEELEYLMMVTLHWNMFIKEGYTITDVIEYIKNHKQDKVGNTYSSLAHVVKNAKHIN